MFVWWTGLPNQFWLVDFEGRFAVLILIDIPQALDFWLGVLVGYVFSELPHTNRVVGLVVAPLFVLVALLLDYPLVAPLAYLWLGQSEVVLLCKNLGWES